MVNKRLIIFLILLSASLCFAVETRFYWDRPESTAIPAAGRILLYDASQGTPDRNITGTTLINDIIKKNRNASFGITSSLRIEIKSDSKNNTGLGYLAMRPAATGTHNVGLGRSALGATTSGAENTAVGTYALSAVTTGTTNTAVGRYAGSSLTTGALNTIVGANAGGGGTGKNKNTVVGAYALNSHSSGDGNVAVGHWAGVWDGAGLTMYTANNSVYIGNDVRAGSRGSDTNSIVIGASAVGLGANTTVIGKAATITALLYGDLTGSTYSSGSTTLTSTNSSVKGKINFGANSAYDEAQKRLGIGTQSPTSALHVNGLPVYGGATMAAANTTAKAESLTKGAFFIYSTAGRRDVGSVW